MSQNITLDIVLCNVNRDLHMLPFSTISNKDMCSLLQSFDVYSIFLCVPRYKIEFFNRLKYLLRSPSSPFTDTLLTPFLNAVEYSAVSDILPQHSQDGLYGVQLGLDSDIKIS